MRAVRTIRGTLAPLPRRDVDTDQIIPARFLKTTQREGLGRGLFADWRYHRDGTEIEDFVLNEPAYREANILVVGDNFGCGSSREHAAWALLDQGIECVISTGFADIFRANALGNGLLAAEVDEAAHRSLLESARHAAAVEVDLESNRISAATTISFQVDPFARRCMLSGMDKLGYLLAAQAEIEAFEQVRGAPIETRKGADQR